ncbi:MAG: ATP-binding protein, partial [Psychromonas sp.]
EMGLNIEIWRYADLGKLRQVLLNLISNAIKFTQRGSIVLSISASNENQAGSSEITFSVTDTGCGIAKDKQTLAFEAFAQVKNLQTATGTGLGLAICQHLVSAMQGRLSVISEENRGSCFSFTIAADKASTEAVQAQQIVMTPSTALSQRYNVLIVEDNEINLDVACALVDKLGHQVTAAKNGTSALKYMLENHYDLALLDINLPDIDGVTLSKKLKAIAKQKHYPVKTIAVSAHVFNEDIAKFIASGFDGFVAKPVQMKKLKPSIAQVMLNVAGSIHQPLEKGKPVIELVNETKLGVVAEANKNNDFPKNENENDYRHSILFDFDIPNQDIEYLGVEKVKQLTQLFCQQMNNEYNDFCKLSAHQQQQKLHKLKGAAIALGLVRLHHLCEQLESHCETEALNNQQLFILDELITQSSVELEQYAKNI